MKPKRYPYSGRIKKTTAETVALSLDKESIISLDKESIIQSVYRKNQSLHQEFGRGTGTRTVFC